MSASSSSEQGFPLFPVGLAALGLLSVVVGRGLTQALPGSIAGYDEWVSACLTVGAFCSQFFAVVGATLAIRAALWLALQRSASHKKTSNRWHHFSALAGKASLCCCALVVCAVVFVAAQPRVVTFGPIVLTVLSLTTALVLGVSASVALETRATRALSLITAHAAIAGLLHTLARLTAYQASSNASLGQFDFARGLSTGAAVVEWLLAAVCAIWLWRNSGLLAKAVTSVLVLCAPAVTWNTHAGEAPDGGLRLALVRSLEQLCPQPDPFLPVAFRLSFELAVLAIALGAVVNPKAPRLPALVVCFALLGRSSGDTPLGALLLLLASLALMVQLTLESAPLSASSNNELPQPSAISGVHV